MEITDGFLFKENVVQSYDGKGLGRRDSMIKNIVFDMGKVLVAYDSMRVCQYFIEDEADRELVHTAVFISPEWVLLDMGVITDEAALKRICGRLPERLHGFLSGFMRKRLFVWSIGMSTVCGRFQGQTGW